MRITNSMLIGDMNYNLNQSLARMQRLQYQNSTGKKFRLPSDDPIGVSKSLKFKTDHSKIGQYKRNVADANSWMRESETALMEINKIFERANHLAVQASNGINDQGDLEKIKAEVSELKESLVKIANTSYGDRYIFSGFKTDQELIKKDDDGNYVYNVDLKPDEIFNYNTGVAESVDVNTLGSRIFGVLEDEAISYDPELSKGKKPYLIAMMEDFESRLDLGHKVDRTITDLQKAKDNILSIVAEVGARSNRLSITEDKLKNQELNIQTLLSDIEDASIPEVRMQFMLEMNVYNASLSVGSQIIQPSLADFIK